MKLKHDYSSTQPPRCKRSWPRPLNIKVSINNFIEKWFINNQISRIEGEFNFLVNFYYLMQENVYMFKRQNCSQWDSNLRSWSFIPPSLPNLPMGRLYAVARFNHRCKISRIKLKSFSNFGVIISKDLFWRWMVCGQSLREKVKRFND